MGLYKKIMDLYKQFLMSQLQNPKTKKNVYFKSSTTKHLMNSYCTLQFSTVFGLEDSVLGSRTSGALHRLRNRLYADLSHFCQHRHERGTCSRDRSSPAFCQLRRLFHADQHGGLRRSAVHLPSQAH